MEIFGEKIRHLEKGIYVSEDLHITKSYTGRWHFKMRTKQHSSGSSLLEYDEKSPFNSIGEYSSLKKGLLNASRLRAKTHCWNSHFKIIKEI